MAHVAFIAYGKRTEVELLFRDMEAQKHQLPLTNEHGVEVKRIWIQGQLRLLPFGIYEYICPKEDIDKVLHTLIDDNNPNRYNLSSLGLKLFRGFGRYKKIPKQYSKENQYLWIKDNVNITVLGIKEDSSITDGEFIHEAI